MLRQIWCNPRKQPEKIALQPSKCCRQDCFRQEQQSESLPVEAKVRGPLESPLWAEHEQGTEHWQEMTCGLSAANPMTAQAMEIHATVIFLATMTLVGFERWCFEFSVLIMAEGLQHD